MRKTFLGEKIMEPSKGREREWERLLEKETEQQLEMEDLVEKYALVSDSKEAIIFLCPLKSASLVC